MGREVVFGIFLLAEISKNKVSYRDEIQDHNTEYLKVVSALVRL